MHSRKFYSFDVIQDTKKLPDGSLAEWDYVKRTKVVVVLPFISSDKILMIREYRPVIRKWMYELPAGRVDKNESPLDAAGRELTEETGFISKYIKFLFKAYTSPGFTDELAYFFIARKLEKARQRLEGGEIISTKILKSKIVLKMVEDGRITNGHTIQMLLYHNSFC